MQFVNERESQVLVLKPKSMNRGLLYFHSEGQMRSSVQNQPVGNSSEVVDRLLDTQFSSYFLDLEIRLNFSPKINKITILK